MTYVTQYLDALWILALDVAPWLILGLATAGVLRGLVPTSMMRKYLGGSGVGAVSRAAIFGTPLPLCSCSVIPAALALRRSGASRGATVSFLIATPENGADSIAVSYPLLGPFMTIARPVAAIFSAVVAGLATEWALGSENLDEVRKAGEQAAPAGASCCDSEKEQAPEPAEQSACCSTEADSSEGGHDHEHHGGVRLSLAQPDHDMGEEPPQAACCSAEGEEHPAHTASWRSRLSEGITYAMTDLLDDIIVWMIIGLALAAAVSAFVDPTFLERWGGGLLAMVVMMLIGVPMYICATASTPVAAALLVAGVSPGAVLVFLLAGPATNVATLAIVKRELGWGAMGTYLGGMAVTSIIAGLLVNELAAFWSINIAAQAHEHGQIIPTWLAIGSLIVLTILGIKPLRKALAKLRTGSGDRAMPQTE